MPVSRREADASWGEQLAYWRKQRHLSQLALASEAEISSRHLSFLETGRARPSREMVLLLSSVLDVPLRERNSLLLAAGFAPVYAETGLDAPRLAAVRDALDAILRQQEPFPAVVMDRHWDIVRANAAAESFFASFPHAVEGPPNVLRLMFHPAGLRPFVLNWEAAAEQLVRRALREAVGGVPDEGLQALLAEILAYPGVPPSWRRPNPATPLVPVVPVIFSDGARTYRYFSAITTLGTAQDVTAQELRVESFFPLDEETAALARTASRS